MKFSSKIQPVCLPEGRTEPQGKTGIVTGWVYKFLEINKQ